MKKLPNEPLVRYNVVKHPTEILVKHVEILPDKSVKKGRGGKIPAGCTITTHTKPLQDYVVAAFNGGTNQYGLPGNCDLGSDTPISPKDYPVAGGVDRTAETIKYVPGPSGITFDHDYNTRSPIIMGGPVQLHELLAAAFPAVFFEAAYGGYDSSGSFIYDNEGNEVAGRRGFHLIYALEDATKIAEFGERLYKHLWLKGYGYIAISKDGKAMPRTMFDKKVIEPQQPLFSGGAHCIGCEQRRPEPVLHSGGYLDVDALPPLTATEEREYQRLVEAEKREAQPECDRIRHEYLEKKAAELVESTGVSLDKARQTITSRIGGTLLGCDLLNFDQYGVISVAEALSNPELYNEATLADPVDGDVPGKAILYMNISTGRPLIYSQSHGGGTYFLKHDIASLLLRLDPMTKEEALDQWPSVLPNAELRPDELERYLEAVKNKTGVGILALRNSTKDVMRKAHAVTNASLSEDPGLYIAKQLLASKYKEGANLLALESGYFWHYTGTHWEHVKDSVLSRELQLIATDQWPHVLAMWDASDKKQSTLASLLTSALACLRNMVVLEGDPLRLNSTRPSVINCLNGELWLTDDGPVLQPHCPDSYLTSCSPILYDPLAKALTFETAIRGMLSLPGGDPMRDQDEMLRHLEELMGYTIQTRRNLKMFVMIIGPGDNGKTTFVKLLKLILGMEAIAFDRLAGVDESGNRFAAGRLVGKLALVDDDVDFEYLLPDGLLKKIAEEKPLTGEGKFKDSFTFTAQVVPWLLGNTWPRSRDLTRGMQTRANVIHLPRSFLKPSECAEDHPDRQRPELWEKVYADEMSGVLNRLISAYYRVAGRKGFLPPESAKTSFDMWLTDANVVARFVAEACESIDPAKPGCISSSAYDSFVRWCEANGVQQRHRPQGNQFKKRLEDIGMRVHHTDKGSGIFGIRVKTEWEGGYNPFAEKVDIPARRKLLNKKG
jgi:P4 family phage/plasmid primase-like protien